MGGERRRSRAEESVNMKSFGETVIMKGRFPWIEFGILAGLILNCPVAAAEPAALAKEIDRLVGEKLRANNTRHAANSDDATFFRRINLVLCGRVPAPSEVRLFLSDTNPNKRAQAVDRLLDSAAHSNHMTTLWRGWLLPEAATNFTVANAVPGFEAWLRGRIRADVPLDRLANDLLTYPLDGRQNMNTVRDDPNAEDGANPLAFYTAKEGKPENLAAATARVFLGVHLECAQCHNHPFAKWSRDQFWGLAAFFGGVEQPNGGAFRETLGRRELLIPNSDRAVPATFLDDREPEWQYKKSPRITLAGWIIRPDNPFFARAMVNRLWWITFGIGLVDPVDDFHDSNPASHPELLNTMAKAFAASGFDAKYILRAICLSDTFGRDSGSAESTPADVRLFARFPVQGLSSEQLFDSLVVVLGIRTEGSSAAALRGLDSARRQFAEVFGVTTRQTEAPTTILQALTLMNSSYTGQATNVESSRLLGGILQLPGTSPAERVESLYYAVLCRPPKSEEMKLALEYVNSADSKQADARYADLLWALLNGIEFRTNH